ncbi:heme oxygenase [Loktanella atrilutea]|uniref:Heme oxygenase n=1 Tax=Loktanella atrilutea TaxID=366533 RepID=A0A1M4WWC7_LOKAT|nr:biliverdin-producing heme oxygenase [Loktanella atrilutea]SHE85591.1 heme oxygenase [Loktanella atrilutea]
MVKSLDDIRWFLRDATATSHRRLDTCMDRLDLTSATDYTAFLMISHRGISQVEIALDAFGIGAIYPNWPAARRLDCLDADLSALGERAAGPVRQWLPKSVPEALGALYVLEGSRLGARILLGRASASSDPRVSRNLRYLRHGQDQPLWPDFLDLLETHVTSETDFIMAKAGALTAFDIFLDAATTLMPCQTEGSSQ